MNRIYLYVQMLFCERSRTNSVLIAGLPSVDGESVSGTYMGSIANGVAGMSVIFHINSIATY